MKSLPGGVVVLWYFAAGLFVLTAVLNFTSRNTATGILNALVATLWMVLAVSTHLKRRKVRRQALTDSASSLE